MAKLFVHIGLPKTATTSLQIDLFPRINQERLIYLGVYQPREKEQKQIYKYFYKAVNTGQEIEKTNSLLKTQLDKGINLLISEEMTVVTDKKYTWREKIYNLFKVLIGLDYYLIVTVREPVSAMFSYYVELYSLFRNENFSNTVFKNDAMKIYHYRIFFDYLFKFFDSKKIFLQKFEDIINNHNKDLLQLLEIDNTESKRYLINIHNTKKNKDNIIIHSEKKRLLDILYKYLNKTKLLRCLKNRITNQMVIKIIYLILNVKIELNNKIPYPSEKEINDLRYTLKNETKFLNEEFNIDYFYFSFDES